MIRIGAVGCGRIGLRHQEGYLSHKEARLVCVCDLDKAKADERARQLGVKAYYTVADMLSQEELDAVDVVTADHLHFEPVMQCLEAGKHTLCEKPLSLDIGEAEQMVAKAKEKGVHLAINYNRRFAPGYVKAREWFSAGAHGKLAYIRLRASDRDDGDHRRQGNHPGGQHHERGAPAQAQRPGCTALATQHFQAGASSVRREFPASRSRLRERSERRTRPRAHRPGRPPGLAGG